MSIVTLQQGVAGYTGCSDTWMTDWPDGPGHAWSFGTHVDLVVGFESGFGKCRILQRWDLSSISPGSICTAASLQLYDSNYASRTLNTPINIYQPSTANAGWVAGVTTDAPETGASCWDSKIYNTVNWAGSNGMSTPTTDYLTTSLASYTFVDGGSGYKTIDFNASGIAYLQSLFGGTGGAGFLIIGDEVNSNSLTKADSANGTNTPILNLLFGEPASYSDFPKFLMRPEITQGRVN